MRVARITSWGSPPECFSTPEPSEPNAGEIPLRIVAVGLHRLVRGRGGGTHPSARGASLPFDPSVDGVGLQESSGELFYINAMVAQLFAERAHVDPRHLVRLGYEGEVDPVAIAALVNPVSSSWMALRHRVDGSITGLTILILGVTSASGRAAAQVARSFGAARIVGASRSLADVDGVDESVLIPADRPLDLSTGVGQVHVLLDYVGGRVAADALNTVITPVGRDLQYIHVGDLSGEDYLPVSACALNTKAIRIMGSGMGSWGRQDLHDEISELVQFTAKMKPSSKIVTCSLSEIGRAWEDGNSDTRIVITP